MAMTRQDISAEVRASFDAWYLRNFVDRRMGRVGRVSYTRPGELDDALAGATREDRAVWYASAYERAGADRTEGRDAGELGFLLANPLVALQLALGVTDLRGLRCYRRGLTAELNRLQRRSYRARYYARDNERRRRLAAERRRIARRQTLAPCPTPEEFLAAFERRAESVEARIRFGGMVHDLECYVDNCLRYDEHGEICGRNGGIKEWIARNLPQLNGRYKTIMRYKALAKRLRQAAGIADPVPTAAVYDGAPGPGPRVAADGTRRDVPRRDYHASDSHSRDRARRSPHPESGVARAGAGFERPGSEATRLETRLEEARTRMERAGNVLERLFEAVDRWLDETPPSGLGTDGTRQNESPPSASVADGTWLEGSPSALGAGGARRVIRQSS